MGMADAIKLDDLVTVLRYKLKEQNLSYMIGFFMDNGDVQFHVSGQEKDLTLLHSYGRLTVDRVLMQKVTLTKEGKEDGKEPNTVPDAGKV